jgi:hypothetical protein
MSTLNKSIQVIFFFLIFLWCKSAFSQVDSSISKETLCSCSPSLPLEIGISSIMWGIPIYWAYRGSYPKDSAHVTSAGIIIIPSLFLLMLSLGPTAEWTSNCEASWWHTLWIGLGTSFVSGMVYGTLYGFKHPVDYHDFKFNFVDYFALGVVPTVGATLIYNLFLHPTEKKDHSMYLIPSFKGNNTASVDFIMKF